MVPQVVPCTPARLTGRAGGIGGFARCLLVLLNPHESLFCLACIDFGLCDVVIHGL